VRFGGAETGFGDTSSDDEVKFFVLEKVGWSRRDFADLGCAEVWIFVPGTGWKCGFSCAWRGHKARFRVPAVAKKRVFVCLARCERGAGRHFLRGWLALM